MNPISLKSARVNANLTQEKLAEKMGVHRATIASWEKEPEKISIKEAKQLSHVLGIPVQYIFFGSNLQNVE